MRIWGRSGRGHRVGARWSPINQLNRPTRGIQLAFSIDPSVQTSESQPNTSISPHANQTHPTQHV